MNTYIAVYSYNVILYIVTLSEELHFLKYLNLTNTMLSEKKKVI